MVDADITMSKYYFEHDFSSFLPLFTGGGYKVVRERFAKGDLISSQGETLNNGYYIISGIMQLKVGNEEGKERSLAFFGPGSIFPLGIDEHHYRMENAMVETALTDMEAYRFNFPELQRMVRDHPDLGIRMIEHYCDFTSFLFYAISSASYSTALTKVASVLYALSDKMTVAGSVPLGQAQVAEVAGVSKVQVARAYRKLTEGGVIKAGHMGVRVLDRSALAELAEYEVLDEGR